MAHRAASNTVPLCRLRWPHAGRHLVGSQGHREGTQAALRPSVHLANTSTLEPQGFEVRGSPRARAWTGQDRECVLSPFDFLNDIFFRPASFLVRTRGLAPSPAAVSRGARGRQKLPSDFQGAAAPSRVKGVTGIPSPRSCTRAPGAGLSTSPSRTGSGGDLPAFPTRH